MGTVLGREPVVIIGVVQAAIVLAVSFGLHLTDTQTAAILAFTSVVLALVARTQVTPNVSVAATVTVPASTGIPQITPTQEGTPKP